MQIQLVLNLQSPYHKIENLQLILNMQHAGPYFHLGALSCFKVEDRSERFAINVIQITFSLRSLNKLFQFINILLSSELSRYPEQKQSQRN